METQRRKVYKLKTWPKVVLVILIVLGFIGYFGYQKYQDYLYKHSNEYYLLQLGYSEDDTKTILSNLDNKQIDKIVNSEYNEFIPKFITAKYFIFNNLEKYLTQVITQDDDFFKYHGTDGYDYDNIVALVNTHSNEEVYTGSYKTNLDDGYAILVNKYYELGEEYEPTDLVDVELKYRYGGEKKIRSEVYDAFINMWTAAHDEEGIYLIIDSGYRSAAAQKEVYTQYENKKGTKYADSIAARAGYSEHQTGLSLDIYSKECSSAATFKNSKTYAWLIENSYKYGFILRYPEGKTNLTGYNYESWHYRYLGVELATKVHDSGLTFDEYYAYYIENK